MENKKYNDWDSLGIEVCLGDTSLGRIRMMRQDMEAMQGMHLAERKDVIEMMVQALIEEYEKPEEPKEE
jgi:hypothetical protein